MIKILKLLNTLGLKLSKNGTQVRFLEKILTIATLNIREKDMSFLLVMVNLIFAQKKAKNVKEQFT